MAKKAKKFWLEQTQINKLAKATNKGKKNQRSESEIVRDLIDNNL